MNVAEPTTITFAVRGLHCASCAMVIDDAVEALDGVVSSATDVRRGRTIVRVDPTRSEQSTISAAIAAAGYDPTPQPDASNELRSRRGRGRDASDMARRPTHHIDRIVAKPTRSRRPRGNL